MDPITLSTTLATLVGLICNYKQEKSEREEANHQNFMEWLEYHRHEDIKRMIAETYHLQTEVEALLQQNQQSLVTKLNTLEQMLATVLVRTEAFGAIARKIHPTAEFSDHARFILGRFTASGVETLRLMPTNDGPAYYFDARGPIQPLRPAAADAPFFQDDLDMLCKCGFLRAGHSIKGQAVYYLTRAGAHYAKTQDLVDRHFVDGKLKPLEMILAEEIAAEAGRDTRYSATVI